MAAAAASACGGSSERHAADQRDDRRGELVAITIAAAGAALEAVCHVFY